MWIGGSAYQVFVLSPLIKSGDLPSKTLVQMLRRFRNVSLVALIVLVVTGGINLGIRRAGHESFPPGYVSALAVKVFLVVAMGSGLLVGYVRSADDENKKESGSDQSALPGFGTTKVTFAFGIIVIFLASMLRQWKF